SLTLAIVRRVRAPDTPLALVPVRNLPNRPSPPRRAGSDRAVLLLTRAEAKSDQEATRHTTAGNAQGVLLRLNATHRSHDTTQIVKRRSKKILNRIVAISSDGTTRWRNRRTSRRHNSCVSVGE